MSFRVVSLASTATCTFHTFIQSIIQCCPYDQQSPSPVVNLIPHCHGCKVHHPTASHSQASPQCPSSALAFTRIQVANPRVLRHLNAAIGPSASHFHNELLLFDLPTVQTRRHIDSARSYRNEAQVGDSVRECGVPREDVFISPSRSAFERSS